jgi:peptide/nickel transport system permease protein
MSEAIAELGPPAPVPRRNPLDRRITIAGAVLGIAALCSALAPVLAPYDPIELNVIERLRPPSPQYLFGTDAFGRDVFSRTLYGGQVSLAVGLVVAVLTTVIGLFLGLISGMFRLADAVIMRVMDGLMAIPGILVAIAMMAVVRASLTTVILAITTAEVPRMVRVVRSVVLTIREQPYIEAAVATGTRMRRIIWRHVLPNTVAPVIVQASFVFASAVLIEAYLSFLGAGVPPDIPSWGNVMAEGRNHVRQAIWILLFPGICLGIIVLAINMLGDGLRDSLDPRYRGRLSS